MVFVFLVWSRDQGPGGTRLFFAAERDFYLPLLSLLAGVLVLSPASFQKEDFDLEDAAK